MSEAAPAPGPVAEAVLAKARRVRLLIMDVDGTLTDGALRYDDRGGEHKAFHAQDGSAIVALAAAGVDVAIVSGRASASAQRRAAELAIGHVYLGQRDKTAALTALAARTGIPPARMAHVGDDCPDLPLFARVGMAFAVADAHPLVRARADHVTALGGGRGAVREVCDLLLFAQGKWPRLR